MCLYHPSFSKLMRSADFTKNICMIAIDEAHCVSQWGDGFRKAFGELGRLRSYVPTSVPFLATSATLPPWFSRIYSLACTFLGQTRFLLIWATIGPILRIFSCHCGLQTTLGLSISSLMKHLLVNLLDGQLFSLTLAIWHLRALSTSRGFSQRIGSVKLIFCTQVVTAEQGGMF